MLRSRAFLLMCWAVALAALGWYTQHTLVIGTDLRLFLPAPQTPQQRLLLEEIGEGPASRVLVAAIAGGAAEALADVSRNLAAQLKPSASFRLILNGEMALDAVPEALLPYRYLLSDTLDGETFDTPFLQQQMLARERDLSSPVGAFLEPWLPRDPTLELLRVLERWQPVKEPHRLYDVWFDRDGKRALLLIETVAPAFDPDRQRAAIAEIRQAFAATAAPHMQLTVSGPGEFSVLMEQRTRGEAQTLGAAATLGMIVLLLLAYRRVGSVILSALPLASAGVVGMFAVSALFGEVHGITLAFGFTLLGVAQDYPIHLLSHQRASASAAQIARSLWPTLATGIASTCIAYFTFLFSGVRGLQQLACFTVTGLAVAGLTTRFLLPPLMTSQSGDFGSSERLNRLWRRLASLPRARWLVPVLVAACVAVLIGVPTPWWENDLGRLTPVPEALLSRDQELRSHLGTADLRYLLVAEGRDADNALVQLEAVEGSLRDLVNRGVITGYDHAARYLPSATTQRERQRRLPEPQALRQALAAALPETGFRSDVFEPFIDDVATARALPVLTFEALRDSPFGASVDALLSPRDGRVAALITLQGVTNIDALQRLASQSQLTLLDLKQASESLVVEQRAHLLRSLAVAAVLLIGVIAFALRNAQRVLRVVTPMALTTLIVIALLHGSGVSLTLFHLISLILTAGLGLDYALFFEHAADDAQEQRRTLHAVLLCSASTLMVFALLASSSLPVLRAIGLTVTLGVVSNFVLAWMLTRERQTGGWLLATGQQSSPDAPDSGQTPAADRQPPHVPPSAPGPLADLLPHSGAMCLLECIVDWDEERIRLDTDTHRSPNNPLRMNGRLRAIHLCEYGAQAMAVHGALKSQAAGTRAAPGMLVALRAVNFSRDYIDDLPGTLRVEANCLQAGASSLQYTFRVTHLDEVLAEGRAAVVLDRS